MIIHIETPDVPLSKNWLRKQIRKLQVFKYDYDGGQGRFIFELERESESSDYDTLILCNACGDSTDNRDYCQVVFRDEGVAFLDPTGEKDKNRYAEWRKGTWIEGLILLASCAASKVAGLTTEDDAKVEQAMSLLKSVAPKKPRIKVTP